jgi:hypothetical protein
MIRIVLASVLAIASLALVGTAASAQPTRFHATMSGLQEVPANASPATGFGRVDILSPTSILVRLSVSGLGSNIINPPGVHLHRGAPGVNGPVVVSLLPQFVGTGGAGFNFIEIDQVYSNDTTPGVSTFVTEIQSGTSYYFNVHTAQFPPGEVRGNLFSAPEPTTVGLLALGTVAFGVVARRRIHR